MPPQNALAETILLSYNSAVNLTRAQTGSAVAPTSHRWEGGERMSTPVRSKKKTKQANREERLTALETSKRDLQFLQRSFFRSGKK